MKFIQGRWSGGLELLQSFYKNKTYDSLGTERIAKSLRYYTMSILGEFLQRISSATNFPLDQASFPDVLNVYIFVQSVPWQACDMVREDRSTAAYLRKASRDSSSSFHITLALLIHI